MSITEIYDNELWKYEVTISQNRKDILREYIQLQINTFNVIIKSSINQNLITKKTKIHAACSIEILNQLEDIYYDFVRIGGLIYDTIYQNFSVQVPILNIKKIPENFCIGYFCIDAITQKPLNVAYIKYYGFHDEAIYKYNNIQLEVLISADPMGLIIPDGININVGDVIEIVIFKS